jgi:hypothetical protein
MDMNPNCAWSTRHPVDADLSTPQPFRHRLPQQLLLSGSSPLGELPLNPNQLELLINQNTDSRFFGIFGEPGFSRMI